VAASETELQFRKIKRTPKLVFFEIGHLIGLNAVITTNIKKPPVSQTETESVRFCFTLMFFRHYFNNKTANNVTLDSFEPPRSVSFQMDYHFHE
jgi:hypothetical protein